MRALDRMVIAAADVQMPVWRVLVGVGMGVAVDAAGGDTPQADGAEPVQKSQQERGRDEDQGVTSRTA